MAEGQTGLEAVTAAVGTAAPLIGAGLGAVQTIGGIIGGNSAEKKLQKLLSQRKSFVTPDEVYQILNATESNAQNGFDAVTLDYLTNQTETAFDTTLGAIQRLGGDPNDAAAAFERKLQGIMKIGADNHALNMERFSKFLGAKENLAANLTAEQQSKENILKDKIAAQTGNVNTQRQNVGNGLNTFLGGISAAGTASLYKTKEEELAALLAKNAINMTPKVPVFTQPTPTYQGTPSNAYSNVG